MDSCYPGSVTSKTPQICPYFGSFGSFLMFPLSWTFSWFHELYLSPQSSGCGFHISLKNLLPTALILIIPYIVLNKGGNSPVQPSLCLQIVFLSWNCTILVNKITKLNFINPKDRLKTDMIHSSWYMYSKKILK